MFRLAKIITHYSMLCLILVVGLSIVDHFLFDERYREGLSLLGKIVFLFLFAGIALVLFTGLLDKLKR